MSVTPFDAPLHRDLFGDAEIGRLLSDSAEIRSMLIVLGALAKAQGEAGLIPETASAFLHRATLEVQIDPEGLADRTGQDGVCVPALVEATRKALEAPEHAQYLHWGATSQDVIDTGFTLRLRRVLDVIAERLDRTLERLADLAETHAETPMAARTYGQIATPTSFGAVVAAWGEGLLAARAALPDLRQRVEIVTLNGAAGTLSVMGEAGPEIRAHMARALGLHVPDRVPHADRSHVAELAAWLTRLSTACGKMATDLLLLTRDGDVRLEGGGGSSTMPQKVNPVGLSVIRALAQHAIGLNASLQSGAMTWDQRDGAAWFAEWLALPQLVQTAGRAVGLTAELSVAPDPARLRARVDDPSGLIHAEALQFDLAREMSRPEAQARVKELAAEIRSEGGNLIETAGRDPGAYAPEAQWGGAPEVARTFARRVRDL
ncbi:lyase family protein [Jannaschia aquimarina]|uniref:PcaB protein n=1 Tax=Jannaschia aquimarina TaxID=935700 RepID=A0A0D1CL40_9RHOB|nr:lyase family protein [Jannaschia aquimarina]KIT15517.1 3-carboxy-cis,cis-muconate cycloisomerase [Jannaschia aquimarina]SNT34403.1 3-carboxy-cis,cis-muconate cycloisomerase [Jannaschia aquimarina]